MCLHRCHIENYKSLILLFFISNTSLKRRFYAGLGGVGVLVFATY
mgnify:CR=1 FL=1